MNSNEKNPYSNIFVAILLVISKMEISYIPEEVQIWYIHAIKY